MSAAAATTGRFASEAFAPANRAMHVLTLTPFYPSEQNAAEGCFISEPLSYTGEVGIANQVIACQPVYRPSRREPASATPAGWMRYFALPGNFGLASAGVFLAKRVRKTIRELHRAGRLQLIHAHAALPCGHAAALLAAELAVPFVVTVHGLDAFFDRQAGATARRTCERIYQAADTVICISQAVERAVRQNALFKTEIVYNGVEISIFRPRPETDPAVVLSVGNLIPIKGHDLLLKAFARLKTEFLRSEVHIVGDGPERENLLELAFSLGIGPRVRFLGRQTRHAVAEAIGKCTVFALPSEYEGLGCVYLEAMAAGKPVIGCRGQGIAEIIEHGKNGILVAPRAEAELADSLRMLLRSREIRGRMGSAARATIVGGHTLAHQAEQLARIYRECAR